MSEPVGHEYGDFFLEFVPDKSPTKGLLSVTNTEVEETFVARIDVASIRARTSFVKEAVNLYPQAFDEVMLMLAVVDFGVALQDRQLAAQAKAEEADDEEDLTPEKGSERYKAAMEILRSDDVLERAAKTMLRLGHVGEWTNKKLAFVCAVSARAQLPVQPSTHAQSSAGKNYLWDTVLALVPPEFVYKRTGFSAKALFRTKMSLKHSVLYIQELAGSEGADCSIRTLQ